MAFFKQADGARIHYRLQGRNKPGMPIILNHGWCSNVEHWEPQARFFSRYHPVLRVDRRGMGKSTLGHDDDPAVGRTAQQHAADLAAVAESLGIGRAVVAGHAGGGPTTLAFAGDFAQRVAAVVMVDSAMYPHADLTDSSNVFGSVLAGMLDTLEGRAIEGATGMAALAAMYRSYFSPKCANEVVEEAVAAALSTPLPTVIAELRGMAVNTEAMVARLRCPLLWLTAAGVDQRYIAAHASQVEFAEVVGAGHFPQLEVPAQVNAMLATFIDQL